MTTIEMGDLIVDLTCQLRDERALRTNLEEDLKSTRQLLTIALTSLHDFQRDPARTARRHQQMVDDRAAMVKTALRAEAA